jgi:diguanylate cyclase (GGDEF)-like protein
MDATNIVKGDLQRSRPWGMSEQHSGYYDTADYRLSLRRFGRPYVLVTALIFLVSVLGTDEVNWPLYLAGWAIAIGSLGVSYLRPWLWLAGPVGALAGALLIRGATDGFDSGLGPLLMIPAVAVAVYGSKKALAATMALIALTAVGVHFINDGQITVDAAWREDAVLVVLAGVLGLTIHDLVSRMRNERALAAAVGRQFKLLADTTRDVATSPDPGETLCDTVIKVTGAGGSALLYLDEGGVLEVVASRNADLEVLRQVATGPVLAPTRAVTEKRSQTIGRHDQELNLHDLAWPDVDLSETIWEPILVNERVIGVLAIACDVNSPALDSDTLPLDLLAAEGSVAIQQSRATRQLERLATTDALTDIDNRRGWELAIGLATSRSELSGDSLCLALLDLDHFKKYNDEFGHVAGDELLRETTRGWKEQLRSGDHIARYGGEEFVVSLTDTSLIEAVAIIERLRASTPENVTCSAGVAQRRPGESVTDLTARADGALYRAKSEGRDRTLVAPDQEEDQTPDQAADQAPDG